MSSRLHPHRAEYAILGPDGSEAGTEKLVVDRSAGGFLVRSWIETRFPEIITATVDWELDSKLTTRLLHIGCEDAFGGLSELELAVTGNGLLAHRRAADGPTQIELGWGPGAELDYLSAAFPAVMVARAHLGPGDSRKIDVVQIASHDLALEVVVLELRGLTDAVELSVPMTGERRQLSVDGSGALLTYEGLLALRSLEPTK